MLIMVDWVEMLAEEQARLHPLPTTPFTVAFGTTRRVNWDATVSVEGVRYSVPHQLVDTRVWVRFHGDDLVVTAVADNGPTEVARHGRSTPGTPSIHAEHYPPATAAATAHGERIPRATSAAEAEFLALGPGAATWLVVRFCTCVVVRAATCRVLSAATSRVVSEATWSVVRAATLAVLKALTCAVLRAAIWVVVRPLWACAVVSEPTWA